MRLAFIAPLAESVPPERYGGTERVVSWLVEELVRRGHEVVLFASADSRTSARLVTCAPRGLRLVGVHDESPYILRELAEVIARSGEFDLISSHVDHYAFPFTRFARCPVVHTLHGRLDLPWMPEIFAHYAGLHLVSISDAQREPLPAVRFDATIHHGLPRDLLRFQGAPGDHLLFLGRISPEKAPELAIRAARAAGARLLIAAKIDPKDREYFESEIAPRLDPPRITFIGEVDDRRKCDLLCRARAMILPIVWPEPFGLSFIEALACGTPVIARPCGAAREIVTPGVTGFLGSTLEELVLAIQRIDRIDRSGCRAEFERRFTDRRMVDDYEALFRRLVESANASSSELESARA